MRSSSGGMRYLWSCVVEVDKFTWNDALTGGLHLSRDLIGAVILFKDDRPRINLGKFSSIFIFFSYLVLGVGLFCC